MDKPDYFANLGGLENCPVCGGKLSEGFLSAPRGVYWSAIRQSNLATAALDWLMIPGPLVSSESFPALKCDRCGIVIVDLKGLPPYTPKSFLKKCVKCGKEIPLAAEQCDFCGAEQKENVEHGRN